MRRFRSGGVAALLFLATFLAWGSPAEAANAVYPKYKEALIQGSTNTSLAGTLTCVLVDTADDGYNAADDFMDDIVVAARVGTPQVIGGKTYTNGVLRGNPITFPAVTGDPTEAVVCYLEGGTDAQDRLVSWYDTGTGLAFSPNGGDFTLTFSDATYGILAF